MNIRHLFCNNEEWRKLVLPGKKTSFKKQVGEKNCHSIGSNHKNILDEVNFLGWRVLWPKEKAPWRLNPTGCVPSDSWSASPTSGKLKQKEFSFVIYWLQTLLNINFQSFKVQDNTPRMGKGGTGIGTWN